MLINGDFAKDELSLYFHIPFCLKKCPYCQFYSKPLDESSLSFQHSLEKHIDLYRDKIDGRKIVSIYFGGGTPSLFPAVFYKKILQKFKNISKNAEITIEANPKDLNLEKLKQYRLIGINRISIGVQAFDDKILKILNRRHLKKEAVLSVLMAKEAGFENISIDLMYDIPHQSIADFENSLKITKTLPINHISLYNLTFEKNTPFYKNKNVLQKFVLDDKNSCKLLQTTISELKKNKFERYEISAFCKNGKISAHNAGYWTGREFLGFGPSAFSFFQKSRFKGVSDIKKYMEMIGNHKFPIDFSENLKYPENIKELLTINLRILNGLNIEKFQKKFQKFSNEMVLSIEKLKKENFLSLKKNILKLTEKGLLFYDFVAEELI